MMKKRICTLMLSVFLVLGLVACGNKQEDEPAGNAESEPAVSTQTEENMDPEESTKSKEEESSEGTSDEQTGDGKTLVVYFSMPETTNPDNMNAEEEYSTVVIVCHILRGCLVFDYEYPVLEEELEKMGIPVIRIESDYNEEDVEQLCIRMEAFIEMIKMQEYQKRR